MTDPKITETDPSRANPSSTPSPRPVTDNPDLNKTPSTVTTPTPKRATDR